MSAKHIGLPPAGAVWDTAAVLHAGANGSRLCWLLIGFRFSNGACPLQSQYSSVQDNRWVLQATLRVWKVVEACQELGSLEGGRGLRVPLLDLLQDDLHVHGSL